MTMVCEREAEAAARAIASHASSTSVSTRVPSGPHGVPTQMSDTSDWATADARLSCGKSVRRAKPWPIRSASPARPSARHLARGRPPPRASRRRRTSGRPWPRATRLLHSRRTRGRPCDCHCQRTVQRASGGEQGLADVHTGARSFESPRGEVHLRDAERQPRRVADDEPEVVV